DLSLATISTNQVGNDLTINTASLVDGQAGAVKLGVFNNTGGTQYLNQLTVTATDGTGAGAQVTLNGNISLAKDATTNLGNFVLNNNNAAVVISSDVTIDTEQGAG